MKRFSIVENGYDIDEVNRFIDIVIGRLEKLNTENATLVAKIEKLNQRPNVPVSDESNTEKFVVKLDVTGLSQEYFVFSSDKVKVNNPNKLAYKISGLNKSVVVVGSEKALESITEDDINVEIDISEINITAGQTISVPANVTVKSTNCWIYGTYTVEVSL